MIFSSLHWFQSFFFLILAVPLLFNACIGQENKQASCSSEVVTERGEVVYRCTELSAIEGESILLPCLVDRPAFACHWFRGVNLLSVTDNSTKYELANSTSDRDCSLKLRNVTVEDDDAWYSCIPLVLNRHPKFDFRVGVKVKPGAPYLIYQNQTLRNGTSLILKDEEDGERAQVTCKSEGGNPAPIIHWLINGELVSSNAEIISNGSHKGTVNVESELMINFGAASNDSDFKKNIQCVVRHPTLQSGDPHWIQVDFEVQRAVSRVYLQSELPGSDEKILLTRKKLSVLLICNADGHPQPSFIFKSRVGNTWREVREERRGAITVRDAGEFKCLAHNELNGYNWIVSNNSIVVMTNGLAFTLPETHLEINGIRFDSFSPVQLQLEQGQAQMMLDIRCISRRVGLDFHNHHLWFVDGKATEAKKMEAVVDPDWPNAWKLTSYLQMTIEPHPDGVGVECLLNDLQASGSYGSHYRAGAFIHLAS